MQPEHIPLTAVNTPLGLYEWLVMPMGLKNAPAIHQRRVTAALRELLGKFCHIYLDDIVIWSQTVEEHQRNVRAVLDALRKAHLYVNPDKTNLFSLEIDFLGHHISARGIEADGKKADCIIGWLTPWTDHYQNTFESIKSIVVSRDCLTTIDLTKLPEYKIFVTTDAGDKRSGTVLLFGKVGLQHALSLLIQ